MEYYPINLNIKNKLCIVVGGGEVGTRKVKALLECFAIVKVISIDFSQSLEKLSYENKITLEKRAYHRHDIENAFLVIGATNDNALNSQIQKDAEKHKVLCNIADCPEKSNFILPSVMHKGDLVISISTSGASPAFARKIRLNLEKEFGNETILFLKLMKNLRKELLAKEHSPEQHKPLFESFIEKDIPNLIKQNKIAEIDNHLKSIFGNEFSYVKLIN